MNSQTDHDFVPWQRVTPSFQVQRRVAWVETDQTGAVHFANYFRYAEEAEYAFLRSREVPIIRTEPRGVLGFPRLQATCEIVRPLQQGVWFETTLESAAHDGKQIEYRFWVSSGGGSAARLLFRVACCRFPAVGAPYAVPLPTRFLAPIFGNG